MNIDLDISTGWDDLRETKTSRGYHPTHPFHRGSGMVAGNTGWGQHLSSANGSLHTNISTQISLGRSQKL